MPDRYYKLPFQQRTTFVDDEIISAMKKAGWSILFTLMPEYFIRFVPLMKIS